MVQFYSPEVSPFELSRYSHFHKSMGDCADTFPISHNPQVVTKKVLVELRRLSGVPMPQAPNEEENTKDIEDAKDEL